MCRQVFAGRHHDSSEAEDITIQEWIINGCYRQCHMWRMKHQQILQSWCKTGPLLPIFEMQRSMGYVGWPAAAPQTWSKFPFPGDPVAFGDLFFQLVPVQSASCLLTANVCSVWWSCFLQQPHNVNCEDICRNTGHVEVSERWGMLNSYSNWLECFGTTCKFHCGRGNLTVSRCVCQCLLDHSKPKPAQGRLVCAYMKTSCQASCAWSICAIQPSHFTRSAFLSNWVSSCSFSEAMSSPPGRRSAFTVKSLEGIRKRCRRKLLTLTKSWQHTYGLVDSAPRFVPYSPSSSWEMLRSCLKTFLFCPRAL